MNKIIRLLNQKIILVIGLIFLVILTIYSYQPAKLSEMSENHTPKELSNLYDKSQYVIAKSKNPISDAVFYAHAGYSYVKGSNPILLNAEHPPFGKYLIGLLFIITSYWKTSGWFFVVTLLITVNIYLYRKTKSYMPSLLFSFFYVLDTNIRYQVTGAPLLDIIQLLFLVLYLIYSDKIFSKINQRNLIISGLILGLLASTKMYFPAILVFGSTIITLLFKQRFVNLKKYILILEVPFIAALVYILTYSVYFISFHGSPLDFIRSQLWTLHYWTDNAANANKIFGSLFPLIFFNKYYVWWGNDPVISYEDWTVMWPISFGLILLSLFWNLSRFLPKNVLKYSTTKYLSISLLLNIVYFLNIPVSPRYLILLFVPGYIIIALTTYELLSSKQKKN
ncbi:MAG: hypothetical protein U0525_00420 [Patescibacteria group bacterium]